MGFNDGDFVGVFDGLFDGDGVGSNEGKLVG